MSGNCYNFLEVTFSNVVFCLNQEFQVPTGFPEKIKTDSGESSWEILDISSLVFNSSHTVIRCNLSLNLLVED